MTQRLERIEAKVVDFIPSSLDPGILYISNKYKTASHLCACGCGSKVVTPLKPGGWTLTIKSGEATLNPSIGNWSFPCQSHYWIRANRVVWAPKWSQQQIAVGRQSDQVAREQYFDAPVTEPAWRRFVRWIFRR